MPVPSRLNVAQGYIEQRQRLFATGTERERRLLSSAAGMRLGEDTLTARFKSFHARGMAIDEAHHFADPTMPSVFKANESPYYALLHKEDLGDELYDATAHIHLVIKNFRHPEKGIIEAIVPQRPADEHDKLLIHEEHHPGTKNVRFRDFSCGAFTRIESLSSGKFDDGMESRAYGQYVERSYYDVTGTKVIGTRVLNDWMVIADCRDIVSYVLEEGPRGFPLRVWGRKNSDVTCCTFFNNDGARTHCGYTDGRISMYTGSAGRERQVSVTKDPERHGGVVREFYAGPPGCTYMTRQLFEDGTINFYTGTTPNLVRLVKKWHPSGKTERYEGEHRCERKVGEGFEPRGGARYAAPSPNLIRGVFAVSQYMLEGHTVEQNERACNTLMSVAIREGFAPLDGQEGIEERAQGILPLVVAAAGDRYKGLTVACATQLVLFTAISPEEALRACQALEASVADRLEDATNGRRPSAKLVAFAKTIAESLSGDAPETERYRLRDEGVRLAQLEGWMPAMVRSADGEYTLCLSDGLGHLDSSTSYTSAQISHGATLILLCGSLLFPDAMEAVAAHDAAPTAVAASSSSDGLVGAVAGATKAVGKLLLGPPAPAPEPSGPKAGTQLRVGADYPRSDLHGKRLALTKPVGGDVWEFEWLDAPAPKLAKGQAAWSIALAQTVTNEAYFEARAAKEAARAAKAESSKAKKRAQRQAKQLEADARLAAELQADEDEAARAPPPGPPPKGKHHALEALVRCPIDGAPLTDAVLASDGWVYNKGALQDFWCAHEALVSPITGVEVTNVLFAHNPLRSLAKELRAAPAKGKAVPTEEPELVLCPITHEVMEAPVLAEDGYIYDKAALAQWFATGATISPLTGAPMGEAVCLDNHVAVLCRAWL